MSRYSQKIGSEDVTYAGVPGIPDLVGGGIEGTVSQRFGQGLCMIRGVHELNAQLESEGTGEDSGQVDSVLAEERPKRELKTTVRPKGDNCDHLIGSRVGRRAGR